jgi:hypothetical protein
LLIPNSEKDKSDINKDAFNFFLSQLKIRIEQSFGLLTKKWRVFKKNLEAVLQQLKSDGHRRPVYNIQCNRQNVATAIAPNCS